ncbi:DUF368 domain-containing protein [Ekhidna sp.]|uniref:DUF368 domain-containing protein n=1 Tax=Ekhidna sp. TaxID=2608089 RepID=UPI003CCBF37D
MINFKLFFKGVAMGCADLIPGVSGGTIALITGIYEELIDSIKSFDGQAVKLLLKRKFNELWSRVNGVFLLHVFAGIFLSIFSLSSGISFLLLHHPIQLWSFFFGLILVSSFYVMPRTKEVSAYVSFLIGAVAAFLITSLTPASSPDQLWFIFLSGSIAICAMILPGISGSFILILLAKYEYILNAVKSFDLITILVFGMGCVIGLISFSKLIHWLLKKYRIITMASLAGFMFGSLNKIWPWKLIENDLTENVSPYLYTEITGIPSQVNWSIILFIIGGLVVYLLERTGRKSV